MEENNAKDVKSREYSRVDACIPMDFALLPEEELPEVRSTISRQPYLLGVTIPDDVEDKALSDWLHLFNSKLDFIIHSLSVDREELPALPFRHVNISASGMRFTAKEGYEKGQVLSIRMVLQKQRPLSLHLCGQVVESLEISDSEFEVAVKFIFIDDEIRDELVRFVFEKQREILRGKRDSEFRRCS